MGCTLKQCAEALCAFGDINQLKNVLSHVEEATLNCTQPPQQCNPYLHRYAEAGVHGTCGANEQTRTWIAQACIVTETALPCINTPQGNSHVLVALLCVILVFLAARALKHRPK